MIRFILQSFLIGVLCFTLGGCQNSKRNSNPSQLTSMIVFNKQYDFGTVTQGETVLHSFLFQNTGSHDLIISKVETNCGCTTVDLPKDPIAPGKKGKIEVAFNSSGRYGKQYKEIRIFANTSKKSTTLIITASIK